ncbi:hypothetical protein BAE44_0023999 [Dichanthelium oligosanthes]|uniref:Uncharacterized protein n=1 Tax=Dichanthelium oligosanthes TaxID=888268 RepID=A0A1E5UQ05_9POAL|nr:hypothetical protein BAE44_0023999 [Dichanthelium oligosanthes]
MASPSSAPTSPIPRQLLRSVPSSLGVAFYRPAPPTISLVGVPRRVDAAASQLRATRRGAPAPKGRPGSPAQGSGGKVHATPLAATARVVMRGPTPPGSPAQGGGGKVHATALAATARVVMRGPSPPGSPAQGGGGSGGIIHAAAS